MDAKRKYAIKSKCPKGLWKAMVRLYRRRQWVHCRLAMHFSSSKMKMYCPCCGTVLKSFIEGDYAGRPEFYDLSLFENVRQDLTCPACGSLPRHRILAMWGERHMGLLIGKDILYFAPERGMTKWMDDHGISYTTADLMDEDADLSIDIQKTRLPENSFDVIICNHVLEHVGDYRTALQEMKRILRPGGVFILSFPMSEEVEYVDEDASVKRRRYSPRRAPSSQIRPLSSINGCGICGIRKAKTAHSWPWRRPPASAATPCVSAGRMPALSSPGLSGSSLPMWRL